MAKKVSEYTTAATVFASGDLFDLTKLVSTSPDVYESQKANANLLAGWNLFGQDQTMSAPRLHNLSNNQLSLTNGRLLLQGSDNIGTDLLKLESLAGTEVFKALNNGTIKISNAFTLPVADGTAGQALLTDGAGAVSFGNVATSSIYTANDTIGSSRVATITDSLTFAGGKLILSSTTNGILLNRVDNSEMNLITGMLDNEIVFNTDLNALYRYDGVNWVALAAGFGIVGTTDATGKPTFYATVKAAYDAGQGSIKLYSDITESVSRVIQMKNGRDIDLNGFTYTYAATDGSNMFETLDQNCTFRIINGRLLRTNALNTSTILKLDKTQTQIDIINVYAENTNGKCLNTKAGIFNGYGSSFIGTVGITFNSPTKVSGGTYIGLSGSAHSAAASHIQNAVFRVDGTGRTFANNATVNNCEFYSVSNQALNCSSGIVTNSYIESTSSTAVSVGVNQTIIGCTIISLTSTAASSSQSNSKLIKSTLISGGSTCISNVEFVEECNIIMNGTGKGIIASSKVVKAINNVIKINAGSNHGIDFATRPNCESINNTIYLNDPTSIGIKSSNVDSYLANNTVRGSTILSDLGTGANLFTATTDAQGNSAQL